MSLLMTHCNSNDVMRQSHDSHVEPKIQSDEMNDLHESIIMSQKRLQSMEKWLVYVCILFNILSSYSCLSQYTSPFIFLGLFKNSKIFDHLI